VTLLWALVAQTQAVSATSLILQQYVSVTFYVIQIFWGYPSQTDVGKTPLDSFGLLRLYAVLPVQSRLVQSDLIGHLG
jgi:hypothetical protein